MLIHGLVQMMREIHFLPPPTTGIWTELRLVFTAFTYPSILVDIPVSNMQGLNICHMVSDFKALTQNHTHSSPFSSSTPTLTDQRPKVSHTLQPTWLLAIKIKDIYTLANTLFVFKLPTLG